jgi:hypothetical protein
MPIVPNRPAPALQLQVGPHRYAVIISSTPLYKDDREVMALWIEKSGEIIVSCACPPESRVAHMIIALGRAWMAHTGEPRGASAWLDMIGTVGASVVQALEAAGGAAALSDPTPAPTSVPLPARKASLRFYPAFAPSLQPFQPLGQPNVFEIHTDDIADARRLAVITLDPAFDEQTVDCWMWMITFAPRLWQALRALAVQVEDIDLANPVADAIKLLWETAGINPFGEEVPYVERVNAEAIELLPRVKRNG